MTRYPFVAIPLPDRDGEPPAPARVRRLLKELGRRHRIRIEWQSRTPQQTVDIDQHEASARACARPTMTPTAGSPGRSDR